MRSRASRRCPRGVPALAHLGKDHMEVIPFEEERALFVRRWGEQDEAIAVFHWGELRASIRIPLREGIWQKRLDSADGRWGGQGGLLPDLFEARGEATLPLNPLSFFLYSRAAGLCN
ncbi:MAG: hypothetical protein ACE5I8_02560 [Thermodesulfobacteriota bacterium]